MNATNDLLVFRRQWDSRELTCAFNLGLRAVDWRIESELLLTLNRATADRLPRWGL